MSLIYDTADNPISSFAMSMDSNEVKTFTVKIDCKTSNYLRGSSVADLTVEAKRSADASWINIETTPINLTPYAATRQSFDVRLTASTVATAIRRTFNLTVGY